MKVLLIAKPWRGALARYLYESLGALLPNGVEWLPTYPLSLRERVAYRMDRAAWRRRLVDRLRRTDYDAAVFINPPTGLEAFRPRENYVLWLTDDPRPVLDKASAYGRVYIADPGYRNEAAAALGKRFGGIVSFGFLPALHRPRAHAGPRRGFCFIGNRDPKRDAYLRQVCLAGNDIEIYGNYFPFHPLCWRFPGRFRPAVSAERMGAVYARRLASINIHAQVVKGGTNMRTFECAGYGIAQIVERLPGLEALFPPEEDVLTFAGPNELADHMAQLERNPELAMALAASARRRALSQHTYFHRARSLLSGLVDIPAPAVTRLAGG